MRPAWQFYAVAISAEQKRAIKEKIHAAARTLFLDLLNRLYTIEYQLV